MAATIFLGVRLTTVAVGGVVCIGLTLSMPHTIAGGIVIPLSGPLAVYWREMSISPRRHPPNDTDCNEIMRRRVSRQGAAAAGGGPVSPSPNPYPVDELRG